MWEKETVELTVRLPRDLCEKVEEESTDFLSRIILYGLTRRFIYEYLREGNEGGRDRISHRFNPDPDMSSMNIEVVLPEDIAEQAREVQRKDPDYLSKTVYYGVTKRSIYRHLQRREEMGRQRLVDAGFNPDGSE